MVAIGSEPFDRSHLVIVGMMGVGKTTIGRLLGRRLGVGYLDSDAQIVESIGTSIAEFFSSQGEAAFRAIETKTLQGLLLTPERTVIAAGGGLVLAEANRELLATHAIVVWLRASMSTILRRVGSGAGRPVLAGNPRTTLGPLYRTRTPIYAAVADIVIDVDRVSPTQVAERCVRSLRELGVVSDSGPWKLEPSGATR